MYDSGRMHDIIVSLDLSSSALPVLHCAERLARALAAKLWLIHVGPPEPDFVGYDPGPQSVRDGVAHSLREEHRELQQLADGLRASGIEATALLPRGPTAETILAEAERLEADLVVMGSHGRGALYRALLGSVSEGVLRRTRVPVLVVPVRGEGDGASG